METREQIGESAAPPPDPAAVREQLERLLSSSQFRNSKRCQALLRFVVEAFLEGALDRVKERTIGAEVFHREAGYDTNRDSVVRTTAAEVRKRLAQYYLQPAHAEELRFALPAGSYVPEFRPAGEATPVDPPPEPEHHPRRRVYWAAAAGLLLLLGGSAWWMLTRPTAFDRFWRPILHDRAEALICIEQPLKIYRIEGARSDELNEKMVGGANSQPAPKPVLEATPLHLSDLRLAGSQYFSFGDLMVATRLAELLARHHKPFLVLGDRATNYQDLRGRPAILLGQFNNKWTLGLTSGLRFYLERDPTRRFYEVRDRQNQGAVLVTASRSSSRAEEYAIVSRIFHPNTEKALITVMGMTYKGTIAGGDFLASPDYMRDAFAKAPAGWDRRNLQVVLRTAMVSGTPGPPQVVAMHHW